MEESREPGGQRSLETEKLLAVPGAIFGYKTRSFTILGLTLDVLFNDPENVVLLLLEPVTSRGSIHRVEDLLILTASKAESSSHKSLRQ